MQKFRFNIVLMLIIIGIGILSYSSYLAGYKSSKNNMDTLLMTMTLDSNLVTAGLYEELPNSVRRTIHFYIEDAPSMVSNVKMFAEVKYVTIGDKVIDTDDGKIWNILKRERIFQRQFEKEETDSTKNEIVPDSPFAKIQTEQSNKNRL